jgi:hypothetical protein
LSSPAGGASRSGGAALELSRRVLSETAVALGETDPQAAARILAAADAGAPARGRLARKRYDALRSRLAAERERPTADEAIAEAIAALEG